MTVRKEDTQMSTIKAESFIKNYIKVARERGYRDPDVDLEQSAIEHFEIMNALSKEEAMEHYAILRLQKSLMENPSADWMREWIHAFAYNCSCEECLKLLKADDVDVEMIDGVFG